MKIKTADLTGPALDWAVAKVQGYAEVKIFGRTRPSDRGWVEVRFNPEPKAVTARFDPSENWSQGGPIIEQEELGLKRNAPCSQGREWEASPSITAKGAGGKWGYGPTPLIAAMRCFVASHLGDEIEIPEELVK